MATIIDNFELDETNIEFNTASDLIKHTDKLVYITGKAGTGKTTFLKYLRETTDKNIVVLAPTGVAAINAGGQTIHSFFQINPSIYIPNDIRLRTKPNINDTDKSVIYHHFRYSEEKIKIILGLELLIIDEISMVRCDLLDVIDKLLRVFRKQESKPFGGVQVILIGDTFQLPPIADNEQWNLLKPFYSSPFFFSSKVIEQNKLVYIEFKKIYRQNEQEFINLLNRIRINQLTADEFNLLNSKYNPIFLPSENSNYITLATHNRIVESTNLTKLNELKSQIYFFEASITDDFPENIMPTERKLQMKEGAQIMFIKNDREKRFYNGKIAKISKIQDNNIIVEFSEGNEIIVEKQVWKNIKYTWNAEQKKIEEKIIGTFTQFPLKLAWAITVHKSQGLTFEKVIADLGSAFTSGQVYVALSRCTTFSGLVLKTRIEQNAIKTDPQVLIFAQNETPNTLLIQELNSGKADSYYKKVRENFNKLNFNEAYNNFIKAIKFRNDIETDKFKFLFLSYASKITRYKSLYFNALKKIEEDNIKNTELQSLFLELKNENLLKEEKLEELNKLILQLNENTKDLKNLGTQQKSEISNLVSNKNNLEEKVKQSQNIINEKDDRIAMLNASILFFKNEIEKLNNINTEIRILYLNFKNDYLSTDRNLNETNNSLILLIEKKKTLEKIVKVQKNKISDLEILVSNSMNEIERQKNIKWYQKIM